MKKRGIPGFYSLSNAVTIFLGILLVFTSQNSAYTFMEGFFIIDFVLDIRAGLLENTQTTREKC